MDRNAHRAAVLESARARIEEGRNVLETLRRVVAECGDLEIAVPAEAHAALVAAAAPRPVHCPAPFGVRA